MEGYVYIVLLAVAYLLPTLIAYNRGHKNQNAICLLNLLLGWTILGWIVSLIWSATDNVSASHPETR